MNYIEFSNKIKIKYPEYKDIDDLELATKIVDKYPEYKDTVDFDKIEEDLPGAELRAEPTDPTRRTGLGEILKRQEEIPGLKTVSKTMQNMLKGIDQLIKGDPAVQLAKSSAILNISRMHNIPIEVVDKNYDEIVKDPNFTGINPVPDLMDVAGLVIKATVTAGILSNPVSVGLNVVKFLALAEAENMLVSLKDTVDYKFGAGKGLKELLPQDVTKQTKDIVDIVDFIGKAILLRGINKMAPALIDKWTKDIITTYKLPKEVHISADKIKSIFQTGKKISSQELDMVESLGLTGHQYKIALEKGINIKIPVQKLTQVVDKPYWAALKKMVKIKPTTTTIATEAVKTGVKEAPAGLLKAPVMVQEVQLLQKANIPQDRIVSLIKKEGADLRKITTAFINKEITESQAIKKIQTDFQIQPKAEDKIDVTRVKKPSLLLKFQTPDYAEELGVQPLVEPLQEANLTYIDEANKVLRKVNNKIKGIPKKDLTVLTELVNFTEELPEGETNADFTYFRSLTRETFKRTNEVRAKVGLEPIKYWRGYLTHVGDVSAESILNNEVEIPKKLKIWYDKKLSSKVFNPTEFHRELTDKLNELYQVDLKESMTAMIRADYKQIYLEEPLQVLRQDIKQLRGKIPEETSKWIENYVNETILKKQTALDEWTNKQLIDSGVAGLIDKAIKPFGGRLSSRPIQQITGTLGQGLTYGALAGRVKIIVRNKFQVLQNLAFTSVKANLRMLLPKAYDPPELTELISNDTYINTYQGFEDLPDSIANQFLSSTMAGFKWSALSNVISAERATYFDFIDLVKGTSKRSKKLKWSMQDLKNEMRKNAKRAHYAYLAMYMPQAFRYKTIKPVVKFQSWWMGHLKFLKTAIIEMFTGKSVDGTRTYPASHRFYLAQYLILGGSILISMGYTGSFLQGVLPTGLPPTLRIPQHFYGMITARNQRQLEREATLFVKSIFVHFPLAVSATEIYKVLSGKRDWRSIFLYKKFKRK